MLMPRNDVFCYRLLLCITKTQTVNVPLGGISQTTSCLIFSCIISPFEFAGLVSLRVGFNGQVKGFEFPQLEHMSRIWPGSFVPDMKRHIVKRGLKAERPECTTTS